MFISRRFLVPTRPCATCRKEQPVDQYNERFSDNCQHVERTICNRCMLNTARTLLASPGSTEIICPEPECGTKFSSEKVQDYLTASEHSESDDERPRRRTAANALDRTTTFIWCAHDGCGSGQFHTMAPSSPPIVTCILCKHQTCAVHQVKWHRGMTCNEYDQQQQQIIIATQEQLRKENSKTCPKCQTQNDKMSQTTRIICSKCSLHFCWQCSADFKLIDKDGAHRHNKNCPLFQKKSSSCTIL